MATDPTLDIDLADVLQESSRLAASVTPASGPWDAIVVGSGAAGGMAAYQLAMAGIKVLVLEAGRMVDHRREYRTMEWPYESPRRHRLPPDQRQIRLRNFDERLARPRRNRDRAGQRLEIQPAHRAPGNRVADRNGRSR